MRCIVLRTIGGRPLGVGAPPLCGFIGSLLGSNSDDSLFAMARAPMLLDADYLVGEQTLHGRFELVNLDALWLGRKTISAVRRAWVR